MPRRILVDIAWFFNALAVTAALLHGFAYILYMRQTKDGMSEPNSASWFVWAFLATLNAFNFRIIGGGALNALQFFTGSLGCILTFLYALKVGKFEWPSRKEKQIVVLGVLASLVWWIYQSAEYASIIIVVAFLLSFKPTLDGVKKDPSKESPLPWVLWTAAFGLTTMNTIWRVQLGDAKLLGLVMPIVLLICHATIAYLCRRQRKGSFDERVA